MDPPGPNATWQMQPASFDPSCLAYLEFLQDDMPVAGGRDPLDHGTLAAVSAAQGAAAAAASQLRKRSKREPAIADEGNAGSNEDDLDGSDEDDDPRRCKRKPSQAAQNKANREKARREKINDRQVQQIDPPCLCCRAGG